MEYYKSEQHQMLLKEATTLLELALWKAKLLDEDEEEISGDIQTKKGSECYGKTKMPPGVEAVSDEG